MADFPKEAIFDEKLLASTLPAQSTSGYETENFQERPYMPTTIQDSDDQLLEISSQTLDLSGAL